MGSGGGKGGGDQTIGYRYFMSLHMGICRGPIDELVQINVGDVRAWPVPDGDTEEVEGRMCVAEGPNGTGVAQFENGSVLTVPASEINTSRVALSDVNGIAQRQINAGEIFGGDKKEGGIQGAMTLLWGRPIQLITNAISSLMGGRVPAFRGVFTLFYDGLLCTMNPYPKSWKFRCRRTVSGWDGPTWQPDLATIWMRNGSIKAMNPAHIFYECMTNRVWGRGYPRSWMDEDLMVKTANRLFSENFGMCLRWRRTEDLDQFVQNLLDHIGGMVVIHPTTGQIGLDLLRAGGTPDYPTFTYGTGLLSVEDDETQSVSDIKNEVVVTWRDPIFNKERQTRLHNQASIQANQGGKNSSKISYDGLPTADLALRIAARDLKVSANSIRRYKVKLDRRAHRMTQGARFRVVAPDMGIDAVVRAGSVDHETDGSIGTTALLDVFNVPNYVYANQEPEAWSQQSRTPHLITRRKVMEASYRDLFLTIGPGDLATVTPDQTGIQTMAAKPTVLSQGYRTASRVGTEAFTQRNAVSFIPYATTVGQIGPHVTTFAVNNLIESGLIVLGYAMYIGDELCRLESITVDAESAVELPNGMVAYSGSITVTRGGGDTVPRTHGIGTEIFFYKGIPPGDGREYVTGETVDVKLLPFTSTASMAEALVPADSITLVGRQGRPYPPGNVRVNGTPFGQTGALAAPINLSWAHRNRLAIKDRLIGHTASSTSLEPGTTYTIRVYPNPGSTTPVRTVSALAGTTWAYTASMIAADGVSGTITLELESVRDGLTSFQRYRFNIALA